MEKFNMENLVPFIAMQIGISPSTLLFYFIVFGVVMRGVSALIPADAIGFLGRLRQLAAIVSANVPNRITHNITGADVASLILSQKGVPVSDPAVAAVISKLSQLGTVREGAFSAMPDVNEGAIVDTHDQSPEEVRTQPMFNGAKRGPDGKFVKTESSWLATLVSFFFVALAFGLLAGCATMPTTPCGKAAMARAAAEQAIRAIDRVCPLAVAPAPAEGIY